MSTLLKFGSRDHYQIATLFVVSGVMVTCCQ